MEPLDAFGILEMRVGTVTRCEPNEEARKPSYKLWISFGAQGEKQSSAQLTQRYRPEDLVGRQVVCATNLGSRRVAGFRSDVLVLGVTDEEGAIVLLATERKAPDGARVH